MRWTRKLKKKKRQKGNKTQIKRLPGHMCILTSILQYLHLRKRGNKKKKTKTPNGQLYINTGVFVFHLEIRIKFVNWAARQAFYLH